MLNEKIFNIQNSAFNISIKNCGQSRVRTYVLVREQIYSLSPLTTRPSARNRYDLRSTNYEPLFVPRTLYFVLKEPKMGLEPATC